MGTRATWIDYAKGIGILLVVYGHVARGAVKAGIGQDRATFELIDSIIYSFHMPLFFFLSGIFVVQSIKKYGPLGFVGNKVDSLLYPYVLWSLLHGTLEVLMSGQTNSALSIGDVFSHLLTPRAHFWFLYALFFVSVIAALSYFRSNAAIELLVIVIALFAFLFRDVFKGVPPLAYASGYFVFFALAARVGDVRPAYFKWFRIFLALSAIGFVFGQWLFHIELGLAYWTDNRMASFLLGVMSVAFVVAISTFLARWEIRWLAFLGINSMGIYLLHVIASSGARIVMQKVFGITDPVIHLFFGTILGVFAPILVVGLIMRTGFSFLFVPPPALSFGRLLARVRSRIAGSDIRSN